MNSPNTYKLRKWFLLRGSLARQGQTSSMPISKITKIDKISSSTSSPKIFFSPSKKMLTRHVPIKSNYDVTWCSPSKMVLATLLRYLCPLPWSGGFTLGILSPCSTKRYEDNSLQDSGRTLCHENSSLPKVTSLRWIEQPMSVSVADVLDEEHFPLLQAGLLHGGHGGSPSSAGRHWRIRLG